MKARLTQRNVLLETGSVLSLDDAQGWKLSCQRGRLWVTVEGSAQEVTLSSGRSINIKGNGRVVVEAYGASALTLCARAEHSRSSIGRVLDFVARLYVPRSAARAVRCTEHPSMRLA